MKERWPEMLEYQQKVQAMTDLERAQAVLHEVSLARSPVKAMVAILAAARREGAEEATLRAENAEATAYAWADADAYRRGAEEMRERAAAATAFCCFECSRVIRALSLTPEEPT